MKEVNSSLRDFRSLSQRIDRPIIEIGVLDWILDRVSSSKSFKISYLFTETLITYISVVGRGKTFHNIPSLQTFHQVSEYSLEGKPDPIRSKIYYLL